MRDLDMRGAQVALLWLGEWGGGQVRVTAIGGRTRVLGKVPGSGAAAIEYDMFGVSLVLGFAQDAGVSYYLALHDEAGCVLSCAGPYDLHRRTGLRFGRASPLQL